MKLDKISISAILVIATIAIFLAIASASSTNKWNLNGEWVDCMPPLSGSQAEKCQYAESIGYPYIAY